MATEDGTHKLIYGPYETLPIQGLYRISFTSLKVEVPEGTPDTDRVVRLDVNGSNAQLAERFLTARDVKKPGVTYAMTFRYRNTEEKLEYRIALLKKGVSGCIYDLVLERIGR